MSTSSSITYAGRGSVHRAAKKALGAGNYKVQRQGDGRYVFFPIDSDLPPPRIEPQTAPAIDDEAPGMKRLRAASGAEEIRKTTLADQAAGRRAAADRIAKEAEAAPLDLPALPKRRAALDAPTARAAAAAPAPAKARRSGPKEGSKTRIIFDMLCRPEGATAKEIAAAGVAGVSVKAYAADFSKSYGLIMICGKEGAWDRCRLQSAVVAIARK